MEESIRKLLDFLAVAEFSQAVLLIFILFVMNKNRKANIFFAAFLFILSSNFFSFYLHQADMRILSFIFASFAIPGISATGVFIFLYAISMTGLYEKFKPVYLLHFAIYFVSLIFFLMAAYRIEGLPYQSTQFKKTVFVIVSIGLVTSVLYIMYTLIILKRYYKKIENYYSDIEKMSLGWLMRITTLSFISLIFWCAGFWFSHLKIIPRSPLSLMVNISMLIIIIFITAYYLINQPEIFRQNIEMSHTIEDSDNSSQSGKYARQNIDERMQNEYRAKLDRFMDENKPYLDENITIKDLADGVGIPPHHLSIVINTKFNKNFYNYINEYRVKEVAAVLDNPENTEASILAIAFRSGFNSKSTFNTVFKKITGQTPSEYRKRNNSGSELAS